jgi:hypothetical protein
MRFKFFILFIFIFFSNVLNKNSEEKNENKFNENENNFKEEKDNNNNNTEKYCNYYKSKYHILKVSPLSDFETINNKYLKLKAEYEEKKDENEIKCLNEAFNEFKEEFKENKKNKLKDLIKYFLIKIIFYILIILICYFFSWIIYKIQNLSIISICFIFSFMLVDRTIPHFFNGFFYQILFSLFLGELIYILIRLIFNIIKNFIYKNNVNEHYE